jgi:hypothetical protein
VDTAYFLVLNVVMEKYFVHVFSHKELLNENYTKKYWKREMLMIMGSESFMV